MKILTDLHCHTVASTHAYSTIEENARRAKINKMELIAITDHAPCMQDSPDVWHFENLKCIPRILEGVKILRGAEANLVDLDGNIDLEEDILKLLDITIVSFHKNCGKIGTVEQNTNAYIKVLENPYVDILGHCGTPIFEVDYEAVVKAAKKFDKIIEINNNTFAIRKSSVENCRKVALLCKEHGVKIAVNTDSHFAYNIGIFDAACNMLKELDFPESLIVNLNADTIVNYLNKREVRKKIVF